MEAMKKLSYPLVQKHSICLSSYQLYEFVLCLTLPDTGFFVFSSYILSIVKHILLPWLQLHQLLLFFAWQLSINPTLRTLSKANTYNNIQATHGPFSTIAPNTVVAQSALRNKDIRCGVVRSIDGGGPAPGAGPIPGVDPQILELYLQLICGQRNSNLWVI